MISILLLEDDARKAQKISSSLTQIPEINLSDIITVTDIVNAKRELREKMFDLILLDIQIPNRFDQIPKRDGGLTFLKHIFHSDKYHLPLHIIVITAYDDIYQEVVPELSDQLIAIVKYDDSSEDWSRKIKQRIEYLVSSKKSSLFYKKRSYENKLAVICALHKPELDAIKKQADEFKKIEIPHDPNNYYKVQFSILDKKLEFIAAATPQMGMTATAVLAMKIIHLFCPKYLAMVGITAGIKGKTNIGDILVADPSWDYGSGKYIFSKGKTKFLPDPRQIPLNPELKSIFLEIQSKQPILDEIKNRWPGEKPGTSLNLHIGPIASGASVIADPNVSQLIKEHNRELVGIEMETYAVMYTAAHCSEPRPTPFSIKSVVDFADSKKNDKYQHYASYTSARLLKIISLEYLDYD